MIEAQEIVTINSEDLCGKVGVLFFDGYRLVQISCTKLADHYQVDYAFDKDLKFFAYRLKLPLEKPSLPSITKIYFAALTYENELHDLFGIQIDGIAIDYKGKFYRTEIPAAFSKGPEELRRKA
ncbi:MAG: hypothetical protein A2X49_03700 [Lentisphaerae bacterium GWF2_52_8]|nr:MAG: hypothetical protein A2X49_03700 [Lentisphaerae bacterium GWF2_52_8]